MKAPWLDDKIESSPAGFTSCSVGGLFSCFAPLRRSWSTDWFVPIVRVGTIGRERYPLNPKCDDKDPAGPSKCPSNKYRSVDFTPRGEGELFLYVNDAVWAFAPGWFCGNNHGTAEVTVRVTSPTP